MLRRPSTWFTKRLPQAFSAKSSGMTGADERARSNPDLQGLTPEGIRRLLHAFVCGGGQLDERPEARPDWLEANADRPAYYRDYWYRALVPVPDLFPHGLFVEVRLFDDDPQDPWVEIVNAHPQV
jgi:hypothetical protein